MTPLDRLRVKLPIVQAPMAGVSTPELAAAVSNAGGLGSIGAGATDARGARAMIDAVRARTDHAFNVNLFVHATAKADAARERGWLEALQPLFERYGAEAPIALRTIYTSFADDGEMLAMLMEARPPVVSFHFGLPRASQIAALKEAGCVLLASATCVAEARAVILRAGSVTPGVPRKLRTRSLILSKIASATWRVKGSISARLRDLLLIPTYTMAMTRGLANDDVTASGIVWARADVIGTGRHDRSPRWTASYRNVPARAGAGPLRPRASKITGQPTTENATDLVFPRCRWSASTVNGGGRVWSHQSGRLRENRLQRARRLS